MNEAKMNLVGEDVKGPIQTEAPIEEVPQQTEQEKFEQIKKVYEKAKKQLEKTQLDYEEKLYLVGENSKEPGMSLGHLLTDFVNKVKWGYYEALWVVNLKSDLNLALNRLKEDIPEEEEIKGLQLRPVAIETLNHLFSKHEDKGYSTAKSFNQILNPVLKAVETLTPLKTNLKLRKDTFNKIKEEYDFLKLSLEQGVEINEVEEGEKKNE